MDNSNFNTFQDYLGLSNVAWAWKLEDLDKLVPRAPCTVEEPDELSLCFNVRDTTHDPLDVLRYDAHEEFRRNGVEAELDEFDIYQSQLRKSVVNVTENPVLQEYLASKRQKNKKSKKVCVFCKNNGEPPEIYTSHILKDNDERTLCPVLKKYVCPLCGASGDDAYTIRYCPCYEGNISSIALLKTNRIATSKKRHTYRRL